MIPTNEQTEAIRPVLGVSVVTARAGTGKTRTMVMKIQAAIASGTHPADIYAITFTVAGARELRQRLAKLEITIGFCGTLHAWARGLQRAGKAREIIADDDLDGVIKHTLEHQKFRGLRLREVRDALEAPIDPPGSVGVAARYVRSEIVAGGKTTFGLMLREAFEKGVALCQPPVKLLIVDEAQDTAPIDAAIYADFPALEKVFVGDPRQAIYGFRGCTASFFNRMARRADRVASLSTTFRCNSEICLRANRLFSSVDMIAAETTPDSEGFEIVRYDDESAETDAVAKCAANWLHLFENDTVAILTRYNATVKAIASRLRLLGVPVQTRTEPEDRALVVAALRALVTGQPDELAEALGKRVEKMPPIHALVTDCRTALRDSRALSLRGVLERLGVPAEAAEAATTPGMGVLDIEDALEAALAGEQPGSDPRAVTVSTIHGSKGREFDRVVIARSVDFNGEDEDDEERRIFYVGITRAKKRVLVTWPGRVSNPFTGAVTAAKESRFHAAIEF